MSISVLLVDASPAFLRVLQQFLEERCGEEVIVAGTCCCGEDALRQLWQLRPRMVLLGLLMPGLGGLQTIFEVRHQDPWVAIIVVTLLDSNRYRRLALAAGADAFVSKGCLTSDLLPAIRRVGNRGNRQEVIRLAPKRYPAPYSWQKEIPSGWFVH